MRRSNRYGTPSAIHHLVSAWWRLRTEQGSRGGRGDASKGKCGEFPKLPLPRRGRTFDTYPATAFSTPTPILCLLARPSAVPRLSNTATASPSRRPVLCLLPTNGRGVCFRSTSSLGRLRLRTRYCPSDGAVNNFSGSKNLLLLACYRLYDRPVCPCKIVHLQADMYHPLLRPSPKITSPYAPFPHVSSFTGAPPAFRFAHSR